MPTQFVDIGFKNFVSVNSIVSVVEPGSAPIKRLINNSRNAGMLVDATYGRRTRSVIIMDSGHVVIASVQPETIAGRVDPRRVTNEDK